jgi:3-oxoacyl-[acyl-carrier protein] reductase
VIKISDRPVALVTGSSRGIGLAIAEHLAIAGFSLVLNGRQPSKALDEAAEKIHGLGGEVLALPFDVADIAGHDTAVQAVASRFGRLDCLVNNAGVSVKHRGDLLEVSSESFDEQIAVNLRAHFFMTQTVARWMIAHPSTDFRSIVTISSSNAEAVALERGEYCVAKTGLGMMTRLFAVRLASHGINVYEVRPGLIATDMTAPAKESYERRLDAGFSPINRWGTPQDVARAVKALASGDWAFTTGEAIRVDGGLLIPRY